MAHPIYDAVLAATTPAERRRLKAQALGILTDMIGQSMLVGGGVFRVTEGLQKRFGEKRVVDTPLAESGIIGTAIGLAMAGLRPVPEIQFEGFLGPAYDQICSHAARMRTRWRRRLRRATRGSSLWPWRDGRASS